MPTHLHIAEDPRDPLSKFRRRELEAILDDNELSHPPQPPASLSREMIRGANIDASKYMQPDGQFAWPPKHEGEAVDIDNMKMPALRSFCSKAGIAWQMSDKKAELQDKARAHLRQ